MKLFIQKDVAVAEKFSTATQHATARKREGDEVTPHLQVSISGLEEVPSYGKCLILVHPSASIYNCILLQQTALGERSMVDYTRDATQLNLRAGRLLAGIRSKEECARSSSWVAAACSYQ